ncbi:peptidase A4 family-domain-containing protein [Amanita rubescens]|nr:peptidase A4 family-domain-containing protein [Amanita rubescens]
MILFKFLVSSFLLITAHAAPSRIEYRIAHRKSHPAQLIRESTDISNVVYTSNWGGIVLSGYPPGTFVAVTGTFVVPTPSSPNGAVSVWVGIDGYSCGNAFLQTGVDISYENGVVSLQPWYEWYPNYPSDFNLSINPGDSVQLTVNAYTTTTGLVTIDNLTTGQSASRHVSSSNALCEQDVEWIVEDYEQGGSLVPMCDFGNIQFTDAYATTANGTRIYPPSGIIVEIEQNGKVYTSVSAGSESVYVSYQ